MGQELLDQALTRIARLESALAITGGTVHDINNLLTVLTGNLYMLTESLREDQLLLDKARTARNTADKCSALMRELLTFSRGEDSENQIICPANHVRALEPLLRRGVSCEHHVEVRCDPEPWSTAASAAQLESAITNLVINARDALHEKGVIRIICENVSTYGQDNGKSGPAEGEYIRIRVVDNGCGIPKSELPKVVEPLFTTKSKGNGTGLGLSMVQRFAQRYGGSLQILSKEGKGTEVRVWLPRNSEAAEVTANMTLPLTTLASGDETIILASKDQDVRAAIQDILQALGYTVVLAALGQTASEIDSADGAAILVCERTETNGQAEREWIDTLKPLNPELRHLAILSAGDRADDIAPDADAVLHRPIAIVQLAAAMRTVLEGSR